MIKSLYHHKDKYFKQKIKTGNLFIGLLLNTIKKQMSLCCSLLTVQNISHLFSE